MLDEEGPQKLQHCGKVQKGNRGRGILGGSLMGQPLLRTVPGVSVIRRYCIVSTDERLHQVRRLQKAECRRHGHATLLQRDSRSKVSALQYTFTKGRSRGCLEALLAGKISIVHSSRHILRINPFLSHGISNKLSNSLSFFSILGEIYQSRSKFQRKVTKSERGAI